jgi:hypothetical protein
MTQRIDPLLSISPANFRTGIAYARALVDADPTIDLGRFMRITHWHGLDKKRGYSRCRFHSAVRDWRVENGYPKRPSGRKGSYRAANWLPPELNDDAAASLLNEGEATETPEDAPELPDPAQAMEWKHAGTGDDAGAALAELVWEWMEANNYEMAAFWEDGEVNVTKKTAPERSFKLIVDGEE